MHTLDIGSLASLLEARGAGLQDLALWDCGLEDAHAARIAASTLGADQGGLRVLNLGWNRIGAEGARLLAASALAETLESLVLYHNEVGDDGTRSLCRGYFPCLRYLNLCGNDLTAAAAEALASSEAFPRLQRLHLGGNRLGDLGLASLLRIHDETGRWRGLRELNVRNNGLGSASVTLLSSLDLDLDLLGIETNPIIEEDVRVLRQSDRLRVRTLITDTPDEGASWPR